MKKLSFIIPCYRSENTIFSVICEIKEILKSTDYCYEIICIDDFSPDNVAEVILGIAKEDENVKLIRFTKNFGQHAGMMAGVKYASGDYIIFIDDDGQCPVDRLEDMIFPLKNGYDIAIAEYGKKNQSKFKNLCSRLNELAANILIDKPHDIQMGNFIVINKSIAEEMKLYNGPYPYISGLLFRSSCKIKNVPMKERARIDGTTTYTLKKLFSLWVSSFTAFSIKPLRIATIGGLILSFGGLIFGITIIVRKLLNPHIVVGWSSLMVVNLLIGGSLLFVIGIIGEYIGRIYMTICGSPQFVIKEKFNV